ncbi:MAG: LysR family transcriptional regulator [Clostridia bacterium]
MELLQLKYFAAAAAQEHITKAAELLHIAQPALTQAIRRLEEELGVKLFDRSGRNIVLNETGKVFLKRITPILTELENLPDEIRESAGIFSRTIHMNVVAASTLITKIIIDYKAMHPQVEFQLMHNEKAENYDIEITTMPYGSKIVNKNTTTISEEIMLAVPAASKYARANRRLERSCERRLYQPRRIASSAGNLRPVLHVGRFRAAHRI